MVQQLNPIDADAWRLEFFQSPQFEAAKDIYDHFIVSYQEMSIIKAAWHDTVYDAPRLVCEQHRVFDILPHYYIKWLIDIAPKKIVDIGCGLNVFKKIYPNIVGIDADPKSNCDIFDYLDADFVAGHLENFDAVISMNTIHFSSIDTVKERLLWIKKMLAPGGRAFVSTNIETWLMHTEKQKSLDLFGDIPKLPDILQYIHQQVVDTGIKFLVIDYPVLNYAMDSTIRDDYNGNLRWVFE